MKPALSLFALAATLPGLALASATPEELMTAMDIEAEWIVPGSVATPGSQPGMFSTPGNLGVIGAWEGLDMGVMYTGNTDLFPGCFDHDWPATGSAAGDRATLTFELDVPEWAHSLSFQTYFLSREYPEYVGSKWNDVFDVVLEGEAYTGPVVFDAFGNAVTINSALFAVVDPALLANTCFNGGTGWVSTIAPVEPGDRVTLTFTIEDVADGLFDSIALVDDFSFGETEVDEPIVDPVDPGELRLGFVSPKEGPLSGGGEVTLFGSGFTESTQVLWDGEPLTGLSLSTGGETIRVADVPPHDVAESIDVTVLRGSESVTLAAGYTYYEPSPDGLRPQILSVEPSEAHPDGGSGVRIVGHLFSSAPRVLVVDLETGDAVEAELAELIELDEGLQEILAFMPPHPEGWVELVVASDSGVESSPGYPLVYTYDALPSDSADRIPSGCACTAADGAPLSPGGLLALLVLVATAGSFRRRL